MIIDTIFSVPTDGRSLIPGVEVDLLSEHSFFDADSNFVFRI